MAFLTKRYAISTGTVMAYDTGCAGEQLMFVGTTLMNTSISQAVQSTQIYGGKGSRLLFEMDYQKEITLSIEDATFEPQYLALQNGAKIANELGVVYHNETVKFDETGKATLKAEPTGNVQVETQTGDFIPVIAEGAEITVPELAGEETQAVYVQGDVTAKTLKLDASSFPKAFKLVLLVDLFDEHKNKVEELQITIPKFKPDGQFELSLTHDGAATSSMNGKALDDNGIYAVLRFIPVANGGLATEACEITDLLVFPAPVELDATVVGDKVTVGVRPIYDDGSIGLPLADAQFAVTGDVATVVDGVVTIAEGAVAGETDVLTVTAEGVTKEVAIRVV